MPIFAWWWEFQARNEEARSAAEVAGQKPWQRTPQMAAARKRRAERMRAKNGTSSVSSG